MSKKRVHEIAKELKTAGIELDNKEVVATLVALGFDVKSHSSSLEADQAETAVQAIIEKRKPKQAVAPIAAKGFVVRRKAVEPGEALPPAPLPKRSAALAEKLPSAPPPAARASAPPPAASRPKASQPTARISKPDAPPAIEVPPARASGPLASPVRSAPSSSAAPIAAAPAAQAARATGAVPAAPVLRPAGAVVIRPGPASGIAAAVEIRTRPTATQAVLVSRPLIPIKRVTPTSNAHKNIPAAPGKKAIGEVREFKVVSDRGGKELVDVSKKRDKVDAGKKRQDGKESVSSQDMRDLMYGRISLPVRGKKKRPTKKGQKTLITQMAEEKKVIKLQEGISVSDLSQRMGIKTAELIKKLMALGKMATANQVVDVDTAGILATDYHWKVEKVGFEVEDFVPETEDTAESLKPRPPVVTVMGHVDHGKTSLLDALRKSKVAAGEAGGITQHIGAYTVHTAKGDITFLDTPGHEAFSAMRLRGANLTDVVVLVVAADDGVMPQTKEAIEHAKAAEVPMVIAINKIDLPASNPDRVKKELADLGLLPEDWGGDTIMVPVSAKQGTGLDLLLENIALQAEVMELQANPDRPALATVIEAKIEKGRGAVASVLVQEGTLRKGDAVVAGTFYGRVRSLVNDRGESIESVTPGYSAEVIGLSGVPSAGETLNAVEDEKAAKQVADYRELKARQVDAGKTSKETLESLLGKMKSSDQKELRVILKADVQGSLEACAQSLEKLSTPKVKVTILQKSVGMMTETDMNNAAASKASVIGFNSKPESGAEAAGKSFGVPWETYSIIYELLDGVKLMMENLLEPIRTEKKLGKAEVRNLFNVPKLGTIAGSAVLDGTIKRNAHLRVFRQDKQIFAGKIASLRRFKDDVREVGSGFECGIGIDNFSDLQAGDIIEAFEIEETRPSLN